MLEEVWWWGHVHGAPWSWDVLDSDGMTPLHTAAVANGGAVAAGVMRRCANARAAWATNRTGKGFSPAQLAERIACIVAAGGAPVHYGASGLTLQQL